MFGSRHRAAVGGEMADLIKKGRLVAVIRTVFELKKNSLIIDNNDREHVAFSVIVLTIFLFFSIIFAFGNIFFFDLNIKFGKTKQKVSALVATTIKTLLAVTQANGRVSRRKLNTGNVYDLFLNVLLHISPISI